MFGNISGQPMYDPNAVQPMRDELTAVGFEELLTAKSVDEAINNNADKTVLIVINSVCGCAAGAARPGVSAALQNLIIPDKLYTVFAGQEREAVAKVREHIKGYAPSSPSIALFENGALIHFWQRMDIEDHSSEQIAANLISVFDQFCSGVGPSVSKEVYDSILYAKACGSKIPLYNNN